MVIQEKPSSCLVCGRDDIAALQQAERYSLEVPGAEVCGECADRIANAYQMAHSGRWLSWPNKALPPHGFKKAKIPHDLRKLVYERDAYRCVTCGTHIDLTLDHTIPESKGGPTTFDNLKTMCRPCNSKKGVTE